MNKIAILLIVLTSVSYAQDLPSQRKIEVKCGQHIVSITCGKELVDKNYADDGRKCNRNTLNFADAKGNIVTIKQPKNFHQEFVVEKTPTALACAKGNDAHYYVTVKFSACPASAQYPGCEVVDLFTSDGKRLTVNGKYLDSLEEKYGIQYSEYLEIEGGK